MQSFCKIRLSVTQKSNCKQNRINVQLYNYSITTCSQSYNDNVMFKVSAFFVDTVMQMLYNVITRVHCTIYYIN